MSVDRRARIGLRVLALGYLAVLLLVPVGLVFYRTFEKGLGFVIDSITTPAAIHALFLTLEVAAITVPLNAAFGVLAALALVRGRFPGKRLLDALIDLPFAISPVVIGLSLLLALRPHGLVRAGARRRRASRSSSPSRASCSRRSSSRCRSSCARWRRCSPEIGEEQEQAAATLGANGWQTFWRVTLPAIRWGLAYGVVLSTARAIGEFGAVSVVSGKIAGETETLTLLVEKRFQNFDLAGAYAASALLALIALATLLAMSLIGARKSES